MGKTKHGVLKSKINKEEKMKIDFSQILKTLDGKPIKTPENKNLTLRDATTNALLSAHEDEKNLAGKDKALRYHLAMRIYGAKSPILLKSEECTLIKDLTGKAYLPLIVGQVWEIIDPAEKEEDGKDN